MALRDTKKKEVEATEEDKAKKPVKKPVVKKAEPKEEPKAEAKEDVKEDAPAEPEAEKEEAKPEAKKASVNKETKAQPNVRIKLARDVNSFIGDKWYRLKKGEDATVPANVKEILKQAGCLEAL